MCGPAEEGGSQPPLLIGIISGALKSTQTTPRGSDFIGLGYRLMALQASKVTLMCNQGSKPLI